MFKADIIKKLLPEFLTDKEEKATVDEFASFSTYFTGFLLQYSVYEIDNSEKILSNIITDINNKFMKTFDQTDSVYIFHLSSSCKMQNFGYARNEDADL
jgi:CRISPR-associated protein Cas2